MIGFAKGIVLIALIAGLTACTTTADRNSMFVTRTSAKSPAELHQAIRQYAEQHKWLYIGDNKLKKGEVTQVRLCISEPAVDIWKVGMHVSAMLPCGHFGIYQEGGKTSVTLMHPRYMTMLDPHPIVQKLADDVSGPFIAMLDEVTK